MRLRAIADTSPGRSAASKFTSVCGLFYVAMGLAICAMPDLVPTLFVEPALVGREAGLLRLAGWIMAVVGWLLWIGGRTGAASFVAAGIAARLAVPLVTIPLALAGILPHMMWAVSMLDPASALLTWRMAAPSR